jgi:hypothetical protein
MPVLIIKPTYKQSEPVSSFKLIESWGKIRKSSNLKDQSGK